MTDSEINKIIAEYIQWKPAIIFRDMTGKPFEGWDIPPDYCNNLNEMHEAEKFLISVDHQNSYISNIAEICWGDFERQDNQVVFNQLTATSRQRAEAFLKTIGKWKE
jgi:hypothetical protein